jgi:hypothetical protein
VKVPVPPAQTDRVAEATNRLLHALKTDIRRITIESTQPIRYRRPLFQTGFVGIGSFGGGILDVQQADDFVIVRYVLSISPYYRQAIAAPLLIVPLIWQGLSLQYGVPLTVVGELIILCRFLYSLSSITVWLRSSLS